MKNHAFTLIELLVVILIIGILAAIAYPQYQKMIIRSKLVPIEVNVNALFKSMEMYEMANGTPQYKSADPGTLDVNMQIDYYNPGDHTFHNKYGYWQVGMSSYKSWVYFYGNGSMENMNIGFDRLTAQYDRARKIRLFNVPQDLTFRKIVCQWWVERHGTGRMGDARTPCNEVGVQ